LVQEFILDIRQFSWRFEHSSQYPSNPALVKGFERVAFDLLKRV
jgi:hypothetical protein